MHRAVLLAFALAACAPAAPPPPAPPPPPPAVEQPQPSPSPPAISIVAEGWELSVARSHGKALLYDRLEGAAVAVDGDRAEHIADFFRGFPTAPDLQVELAGSWPDALVAQYWSAGGGSIRVLHRTAAGWLDQRGLDGLSKTGSFVAGIGGGAASLFYRSAPDPTRKGVFVAVYELMALGGDEARSLGAPGDGIDHVSVSSRGDVAVIRYAGRGALQVALRRPGEAEPAILDVPAPPEASPTYALNVTSCLAADGTLHVIRMGQETKRSAILTLRGATWESQVIPGSLSNYHAPPCAVGGDGSLWFVLDYGKALMRRDPSGEITQVPLPQPAPLKQRVRLERNAKNGWLLDLVREDAAPPPEAHLVVDDLVRAADGTIWITADRDGFVRGDEISFRRTVVLRAGPQLAGGPLDWDTLAPGRIEARVAAYDAARGVRSRSRFGDDPIDPKCHTVFVRLATLPKTTPADYAFPLVRDAVKGRADLAGTRFVEAVVEDQRVLGALVPSLATGQALIALLKGKISSAGARALCGRPKVTRSVAMGIEGE